MKKIMFISFGKDSLCSLIESVRLGIKIDEYVYCDIRFDNELSGEHPLMAEWIPQAEQIINEKFGITIKHITAPFTFVEYFYRVKQRGNHIGDIYGYPYIVGAWCNSRLKLDVISRYIKSLKEDVEEYVGIAYDEPARYNSLVRRGRGNKRSLLFENAITEKLAFKICEQYGLVSPFYKITGGFRCGCWFCVKQCFADLYDLYKNYQYNWNKLKGLEKDSFNTFKPKLTLCELEQRFNAGYIPERNKCIKSEV